MAKEYPWYGSVVRPGRPFWVYGAEARDPDSYLLMLWDEASMCEKGRTEPLPAPGDSIRTVISFEDLKIDERSLVGAHTVSKEEAIDFARKWEPQPYHVDEASAEASLLRRFDRLSGNAATALREHRGPGLLL